MLVYVPTLVYMLVYVPTLVYMGGIPPCVYALLHHPGYTQPAPSCTCRTAARYGRDELTALSRSVAERTVSDEPLTVAQQFPLSPPVSLLDNVEGFPSNLWKNREGGEACCAECSSPSNPVSLLDTPFVRAQFSTFSRE